LANAKPGEVVYIRYRSTNNNAKLEWQVNWTQAGSIHTGKYYAGPEEVQACGDIRHPGDWVEFACARTGDDNNPGT
jgi:hypothetical protein